MTTLVTETRPAATPGAPAADTPARPGRPDVLATARALIERGWLHHGWCEDGPTGWWDRLRQGPPAPDQVERACLVAAIAVAAHGGGPFLRVERDARPWIDAVWRALREPERTRALSPAGLAGRIRDLTAWNDAPGRTRGEVLGLLGVAQRRTVPESFTLAP
jgi:hypothetical protein